MLIKKKSLPPFIQKNLSGKFLVYGFPLAWLLVFFLIPLFVVLRISFSEAIIARPPYSPLYEWVDGGILQIRLFIENYTFIIEDYLYINAYISSVKIAGIATIFCLLLGYPMAYYISRCTPSKRNILLLLVILPFWTSFLLRVYAWIGILKNNGVINNILMGLGVIDEPIVMMQTDFAVYIGIVYSYLPFMILPLYTTLEKLDNTLLEASADLGCKPWKSFLTITLPLSWPGILSGCLLVFIPAVGEFVIPTLLGGPETLMIGKVLWTEFFNNRDWPIASAVAIIMLLLLVVPIMLFRHAQKIEAK